MKIVSFNINGLRARPHQLEAIRDSIDPDIIGLQETKVQDEHFPLQEIQEMGYHALYMGQKTHYGVALLSKQPWISSQLGFPGDDEQAQKRFIGGCYSIDNEDWFIYNGYFPQGESRDHPVKFPAKRKFYADLLRYLKEKHSPGDRLLVIGDNDLTTMLLANLYLSGGSGLFRRISGIGSRGSSCFFSCCCRCGDFLTTLVGIATSRENHHESKGDADQESRRPLLPHRCPQM